MRTNNNCINTLMANRKAERSLGCTCLHLWCPWIVSPSSRARWALCTHARTCRDSSVWVLIEGIEAHVFCWFGKTVMGRSARGQGRRRGHTERWGTDRQRENTNSNSNSKTLFYKDCSLGSVKNLSDNWSLLSYWWVDLKLQGLLYTCRQEWVSEIWEFPHKT